MDPPGCVETHSATVLFAGDRAYKWKKPVDLGSLDFRTVEARRDACRRELELNRRLCPDVYLDVAEMCDGAGRTCEWVLVMRRMPATRRPSTLVRRGEDVRDALRALARRLAAFHATARTGSAVAAQGTATSSRTTSSTCRRATGPGLPGVRRPAARGRRAGRRRVPRHGPGATRRPGTRRGIPRLVHRVLGMRQGAVPRAPPCRLPGVRPGEGGVPPPRPGRPRCRGRGAAVARPDRASPRRRTGPARSRRWPSRAPASPRWRPGSPTTSAPCCCAPTCCAAS
ncbi:MAG: uncharacterized protein QOC93_2999 [Actinomycetota bacterium]|nr:uncharacterized protein [Actinomycetota bacterium]